MRPRSPQVDRAADSGLPSWGGGNVFFGLPNGSETVAKASPALNGFTPRHGKGASKPPTGARKTSPSWSNMLTGGARGAMPLAGSMSSTSFTRQNCPPTPARTRHLVSTAALRQPRTAARAYRWRQRTGASGPVRAAEIRTTGAAKWRPCAAVRRLMERNTHLRQRCAMDRGQSVDRYRNHSAQHHVHSKKICASRIPMTRGMPRKQRFRSRTVRQIPRPRSKSPEGSLPLGSPGSVPRNDFQLRPRASRTAQRSPTPDQLVAVGRRR